MENIKLYTLQEVANILMVTRQTIYNYKKSGKLKTHKIGRIYRVSAKDLQDFIEKDINNT